VFATPQGRKWIRSDQLWNAQIVKELDALKALEAKSPASEFKLKVETLERFVTSEKRKDLLKSAMQIVSGGICLVLGALSVAAAFVALSAGLAVVALVGFCVVFPFFMFLAPSTVTFIGARKKNLSAKTVDAISNFANRLQSVTSSQPET
jgi:hypothetical protein